jgi:hypothetical protein
MIGVLIKYNIYSVKRNCVGCSNSVYFTGDFYINEIVLSYTAVLIACCDFYVVVVEPSNPKFILF